MQNQMPTCIVVIIVTAMSFLPISQESDQLPKSSGAYVLTGSLPSPLANQAAAATDKLVFAIDNGVVGKYDRTTGKELARSVGKAEHLNSGFLWQGKLYCSHSNYPKMPHQSDIRVLDPETMKLTIFHTFDEPPGSLTWAVRRGEHWWCHFAHYGKDNEKSVLVQYDNGWKEISRWKFPKALVADWGNYSLSGGVWIGDELLATGHDKKGHLQAESAERWHNGESIGGRSINFSGSGHCVRSEDGRTCWYRPSQTPGIVCKIRDQIDGPKGNLKSRLQHTRRA